MKKPMRTVNEAEAKEHLARLVPGEGPRISREEFLRRAAEIRGRQPKQTSLAEDLIREDRNR